MQANQEEIGILSSEFGQGMQSISLLFQCMKYGKWQARFYTISTWSEVNHRDSPHQKGGWEMYLNQVPRRDRKSILQRVHVVRVPYDSPHIFLPL